MRSRSSTREQARVSCLVLVLLAAVGGCGDNASPTSPSTTSESSAGSASPVPEGGVTQSPAFSAGAAARRLSACALRPAARAPADSLVASVGTLDLAPRISPVAPPRLVLRIPPWPGDSLVPACPEPVRLLRKPQHAPKAAGRRE